MPNAIVLRAHGDADALRLEPVTVGAPGPGELRVRQTAIGVNFHDTYVRSGLYRTLALPGIPGIEAVGVVEAVGDGVGAFRAGDRVGYVTGAYGAYASERVLPADLAFPLPSFLDDLTAASVLVRGLTVEMLTRTVHPVRGGDLVLVHAAAGGVGRLLCQRLADIGAVVIGTAGSAGKAAIAQAAGCRHVILYREEDFVTRVRTITGGHGVAVAYDSVGRDTFDGSLACLATRGHLVNFGQASGPVPPFEVSRLAAGSFSVTRPILFHYISDPAERDALLTHLFEALARGVLSVPPAQVFPLGAAAEAHAALESRAATGPILLRP
ncbi:MAG: quinone oxidoreductase [Acetobacteraceae bacterium]